MPPMQKASLKASKKSGVMCFHVFHVLPTFWYSKDSQSVKKNLFKSLPLLTTRNYQKLADSNWFESDGSRLHDSVSGLPHCHRFQTARGSRDRSPILSENQTPTLLIRKASSSFGKQNSSFFYDSMRSAMFLAGQSRSQSQ